MIRVAFQNAAPDFESMELIQLSPAQLRQAAAIKERILELQHEMASILGTTTTQSSKVHWTQKVAGRAWRTRRGGSKPTSASGNGKGLHWTQTPAGRARMAKLMRKRWQSRRAA